MVKAASMCPFDKRGDYAMPWKVSLCFNVSQRDQSGPERVQGAALKCGTMRSRADGVWYYEVNTFTAIVENVIPFFDRFGFLSAKKQRDLCEIQADRTADSGGRHLSKGHR